MQHPDEGTIHSWLDGQLPLERAAEVSAHTFACQECAAAAAEARGLIAASTRILTALDDVSAEVIPEQGRDSARMLPTKAWYDRTDIRAAAVLVLVAGASLAVVRSRHVAESELAPATTSRSLSMVVADSSARELSKTTQIPTPEVSVPSQSVSRYARLRNESSSAAGRTSAIAMSAGTAVKIPSLRILRANSAGAIRRTVYEVSSGVEVTLTESPASRSAENDFSGPRSARGGAPAPATSTPRTANTISWIDGSRLYSLTGALSTEELEALKARLQITH